MEAETLLHLLCNSPVIPAARNAGDFEFALTHTKAPSVILLFGDINILPELLAQAKKYKKRLLVHLDLLEGVGRDPAGIRFLARMGVAGLITTKSHLCKAARKEGMIVVQRLFVMDSDALHTGISLLRKFHPDAVEILPASVPAGTVEQIVRETGLIVLGGGLMQTVEDVNSAINNGIKAVSVSKRELWLHFLT